MLGELYLLWVVGGGEGFFLHVGQRSVGHGQGDCRGDGDQDETHRTDHSAKVRRRFFRCSVWFDGLGECASLLSYSSQAV